MFRGLKQTTENQLKTNRFSAFFSGFLFVWRDDMCGTWYTSSLQTWRSTKRRSSKFWNEISTYIFCFLLRLCCLERWHWWHATHIIYPDTEMHENDFCSKMSKLDFDLHFFYFDVPVVWRDDMCGMRHISPLQTKRSIKRRSSIFRNEISN